MVEFCISGGKLKYALSSVRALALDEVFPDIEQQYRCSCVTQLLTRGLWGAAAGFVGDDAGLQRQLVLALIGADEASMALVRD